jgi:hypothetical protein
MIDYVEEADTRDTKQNTATEENDLLAVCIIHCS